MSCIGTLATLGATNSEQFEVDRSPIGILRRRTQFFVRYLLARAQSGTIAKLLPIVESSFEHPWVAEIELRIRFWPGKDVNWLGLWSWSEDPQRPVCWDAPVAICIHRKKRGKQKQALCMSLYLINGTVYIGQLQGVSRTNPPKEIRFWPMKFMEACQTFARQENLKEVKVARADTLYSYRNPYLNPELSPEAREQALGRIRKTMELIYDANAVAVGFVPDGNWFKWENPKQLPARTAFWPAAFSAPVDL